MYLSEQYEKKWQPVLEHPDLPKIGDSYKRAVTATILENQERAMKEDSAFMTEAAPTNNTGGTSNWDPILISLVRRAMPNLIAYDIAGVQPMTGPTGLIFAMRSRYTSATGNEALFDEADTEFSSRNAAGTSTAGQTPDAAQAGSNPGILNDSPVGAYNKFEGMTTATAEALGDASGNVFAEMAFSIEKTTVTARSRALKAEYTMELAQDLKAIHATNATTAGVFDLDTDSNGRWSVERFKGLMFQLERDANTIAQRTRRGKGNMIICSSDVASALQMAGVLDYAPALNNNLNVDDTGNTFKVYIDPYSANNTAKHYFVVGYKGTSPYDAGMFYCPYVPLQMVRAVGENSFQPKIGFKTRYGIAANPFHTGTVAAYGDGAISISGNTNKYYRRVKVTNLM